MVISDMILVSLVVLNLFCVDDFCLQAIDEGTMDALDHSDFLDTDIPFEVPVPTKLCVTVRHPSTSTPDWTHCGDKWGQYWFSVINQIWG